MNADLKLPVKCLKRNVLGKLIEQSKNGLELVRAIETLKSIWIKGFSDRLHYMTPTFYFRQLAEKKVGGNQIGFALLLKHFQLFAYFPEDKSSISQAIISYIALQVNLPESSYSEYDWQGRSAKVYRVEIRRLFNFKVASVQNSEEMVTWLIDEILPDEPKNALTKN